jgi:hypothetical protein
VLHSALTLVQKSKRFPVGGKGRGVRTLDEKNENGRLFGSSSFGVGREAKVSTAFCRAFSFVSNGPVMVALRFRFIDASAQYHPCDPLSPFPMNTPTFD